MVSVYGTPLRRLYIQRFNLENGGVHRVFPPRFKKKMLAEQALKAMRPPRVGLKRPSGYYFSCVSFLALFAWTPAP